MPEIDFFKDAEFKSFVASLNAEMKRLQSNGIGSTHKQAEPINNGRGGGTDVGEQSSGQPLPAVITEYHDLYEWPVLCPTQW